MFMTAGIIVDKTGGTNMSNDKLSSLVKDYVEIDAEIKANQLLAEEIRNEIKAEMNFVILVTFTMLLSYILKNLQGI